MSIEYFKTFLEINHCNTTCKIDAIIILTKKRNSKILVICSNMPDKQIAEPPFDFMSLSPFFTIHTSCPHD